MFPPNPYLRLQGIPMEEDGEKSKSQRAWRPTRKQDPLYHHQTAHMNSQTKAPHLRTLQIFFRYTVHIVWLPVECIYGIPEREKSFANLLKIQLNCMKEFLFVVYILFMPRIFYLRIEKLHIYMLLVSLIQITNTWEKEF